MRIALVVEATTGGVARHLIDLVTHLDRRLVTPVLYLSLERPESWRGPLLALREQDVLLREIPMTRVPDPLAVNQIAGWARRDAIDLLHLHSAKAGYLGRIAAKQAGLPAIYTPHAFPFQRSTDWLRPVYLYLERKLAAQTARIICVSEGERQEGRHAGLPEDKLVVVPNGLDTTRWTPPTPRERRAARRAMGIRDGEVIIGAMARHVSQKGLDLLLLAAEDALADFPHARLIIWGDGPQRKSLQQLARTLTLRNVWFVGATTDAAAAYAAMDIYCAPSRWEAGPYAILEAMACGLPVVASRIPGHTDVIEDGVSGVLCDAELPGPFAGALRRLLADEDNRAPFAATARTRVETAFMLARMIEGTQAVYREVAAQAGVEMPV